MVTAAGGGDGWWACSSRGFLLDCVINLVKCREGGLKHTVWGPTWGSGWCCWPLPPWFYRWSKWLFGCSFVWCWVLIVIVHLLSLVPYQLSVRVLARLSPVGAMCFPAKISFCKTSESRFAKRGTLLRKNAEFCATAQVLQNFAKRASASVSKLLSKCHEALK